MHPFGCRGLSAPERPLLLPGQRFALRDWGHRNDYDWPMLTMRQVGGDRAGEELLQSSSYPTAAAADDDQLDIQDVGESSKRVRDVARQFPEGQVNGVVSDRRAHLRHQPLVEVGVLQFGQFWIKWQRNHRAVRAFLDHVTSGIDVGTDQRGAEDARKACGMAQHRVGLTIGHPHQNPTLCLMFRHRLTPRASSPDPSAGSIGEPGINALRDWCRNTGPLPARAAWLW